MTSARVDERGTGFHPCAGRLRAFVLSDFKAFFLQRVGGRHLVWVGRVLALVAKRNPALEKRLQDLLRVGRVADAAMDV